MRAKAGAALAALAALLWFGYAVPAVVWTARRAPAPEEVAGPIAEAALVPGAAAWGDRPSPALADRLEGAVALWRAGSVQWIVVTGGSGHPGAPTEAAVGARYLEERGVPRSAILLEESSRDTAGNLAGSRPLLAARGIRRVAVVSHGFHLYRSLLMARDLGLEPVPVAVPNRWLSEPYYTVREALALLPYWAWVRWRLRGYGPGGAAVLNLAAAALALMAVQTAYALWLLRSRRRCPPGPAPAGVSVILPIKGLDPGAEAHFRHWLAQDPGAPWEVIFSLQDPADPALPVVRALAQAVPDRARVLVNPVREGLHGKASNLWHGVRAARYPLLVMADSDIDPPPDLLRRLLPPLADPRVGLVAGLPVAVRARGLWGRLTACGINL
ncbi:MAG: ElyC/SanA/YdcF family protein, partial [Bacillota bacterium]